MYVLFAHADVSTRKAFREAMARFGYRPLVATDGGRAWEHISSGDPDVAILALDLAEIDGLTLLQRARQAERSRDLYLVAVVPPGKDDLLALAMGAGADDFLLDPFSPEQLHARLQVAERFSLLDRQLGDHRSDLDRARSTLRASARTDPVTQLWNRAQLNDDLNLFQSQLLRYGHRYAAALFSVDDLYEFNQVCGVLARDEVLRLIAETLARQLRTGDRAYRYADDSIVVLLPEQDVQSALVAAERMRAAVEGLGVDHVANEPWRVFTVSVGVAVFDESLTQRYSDLLARAEDLSGLANRSGRNRVAVGLVGPIQ